MVVGSVCFIGGIGAGVDVWEFGFHDIVEVGFHTEDLEGPARIAYI